LLIKTRYSILCAVPPHPDLVKKLYNEYKKLKKKNKRLTPLQFLTGKGLVRERVPGLDDNLNIDPEMPQNLEANLIQLPRFKPRGDTNTLFLLVDFEDKPHSQSPERFKKLLFSQGNTRYDDKSLNEYYSEVSYGQVNIIGYVSDWMRMPKPYSYYVNGRNGLSHYPTNAQRMVEDAVNLAKQQGGIDWDRFDVDGDGMIDALSVIHAGRGAEQTGPGSGEIWSHKWNMTSRIPVTPNTYSYLYQTVPEDARLGVIAHEIGHLVFGWPDLYDAEPNGIRVTEGLGSWCLMAAGSWNNNGNTPGFPCAWCRHVQGWTNSINIEKLQHLIVRNAEENREIYRLWTKGKNSQEYFMLENRQKVGFDKNLPGDGILVYQIDEVMPNNYNEDHLAVGLMQADGRRDLQEIGGFFRNQGDASDPYPGTTKNYVFANNTKPNSKSFAGKNTGVFVQLLDKQSSKAMEVRTRV
jgi:immune inhibitor A